MANITPQSDLLAGVAGQSGDTILPDQVDFLAGHLPPLFSTAETVLSGEVLAALTVVGFDADGKVVEALTGSADPADDIQAVGVMPYAVDASGGDVDSEIYRSGNFDPAQLVWPDSFDTDAKKRAAFEGAPSPTQVVITPNRTFAV